MMLFFGFFSYYKDTKKDRKKQAVWTKLGINTEEKTQ